MTAPTPTRRPVGQVVGEVAGAYIAELQAGYLADRSAAVATLARLRRGAGKLPQEAPDLWGIAGIERLYGEQGLSERDSEQVKDRAESALFLAVTLYALHQQSRKTDRMHRPRADLGAAVRRLMPKGGIDEPIRRRFVRTGTATSLDALAYRLREIVSLLRGASIPLDYGLLARQLYQAQWPEGLRQVRHSWGRGFHAYLPPASSDGSSDSTPDSSSVSDDDPIDKDM
ncbi:type I-E CRISPR-associated protein Cse2/CasB [Microbispora sp. NBC_01189]|uniref:type I-E CRISPR-associated protein Cse2/CasB n=1 Tax=Microbispora sp. NBC_01189 TaxID=2903583 RepID=UPI002E0FFEE6|nr:type I-E CRISPR-associated protein Cse2/CasB [Microbispora sp. NBC_01189]